MKFSPWLSLYFRVSLAIAGFFIVTVQGAPEHFGGKEVAGDISFWLGVFTGLQSLLFSFGGTGNQTSLTLAGPVK